MKINALLLEEYLLATRELRDALSKRQHMDQDKWEDYVEGFWEQWDLAYANLICEYEEYDLKDYGIGPDYIEKDQTLRLASIIESS